ncbi:MAG: hypothetical protein DMF78_19615 [Acidobacteria bacterium]|nr:MAG: hypothetical protein DMF78_19615 [Acidobacteriota bacterium]
MLTLALGIGASSTIFSVVNAVLLRPLPFRNPQRLIAVSQFNTDTQAGGVPVSFTKYEAIRDQARSLDGLAVYYPLNASLGGESEPEQLAAARVSGDLFGLLGAAPARGRGFQAEELAPGGGDVAVITDALWHRRFGGDPELLGRSLRLDGKDVTVVGILPPSFHFPLLVPEPQVWLPRVFEPDFMTPAQVHSGASYLSVVARLRPGETLAHAQAELDTIDARYRQQYGSYVDAARFQLQSQSLSESLVGATRRPLGVLLAAVSFVLLIVCTNVASLQLARGFPSAPSKPSTARRSSTSNPCSPAPVTSNCVRSGIADQTCAKPPSTNSSVPVTKLLSSEARNTTAFAISSGLPSRPSGTMPAIAFRRCSPAPVDAASSVSPGVSMGPGLTAFTRMRRSFRSVVHVRANDRTAALVAL